MMLHAQHHSKIVAEYDEKDKKINVVQELTFFKQTNDTLQSIVLNDWMNAYGDKNSDIGKRFADEFERAFHLAKEKDRGRTENITIITIENSFLSWKRDENSADIIEIQLKEKLSPGEKIKLHLTYSVKIPNARFTKFGFTDDEKVYLKNWFLTPSRYENGSFVKYNNHNIDDIANARLRIPCLLCRPRQSLKMRNGQKYLQFIDIHPSDPPLYFNVKCMPC